MGKKVSVITPAYNASEYIVETIESVLSQSYTDWEMLIVDDCSTDNTVEIVSKYCEKDSRIKLLKHTENQGVAAARNTALKEAKGEYIAFLDSDDMWHSEKLLKQLAFMEENQYVLTYTGYQKYLSESKEKGKIIDVPPEMTYESIFYNTAIACLTVMVNAETVGEFSMPLINHTEDQCTWQSILKICGCKAYGLNENLALYRVSSNSLTGNKFNAVKKQWNTYRKYHKLSVLKSGIYFVGYVFNALKKHY